METIEALVYLYYVFFCTVLFATVSNSIHDFASLILSRND